MLHICSEGAPTPRYLFVSLYISSITGRKRPKSVFLSRGKTPLFLILLSPESTIRLLYLHMYCIYLVLRTLLRGPYPAYIGATPPPGAPRVIQYKKEDKKDLQEDWLGPPGDSHARPIPGPRLISRPVLYYPGHRHAFAGPRPVRTADILRPYSITNAIRIYSKNSRLDLRRERRSRTW
jgi:hypothetical protein